MRLKMFLVSALALATPATMFAGAPDSPSATFTVSQQTMVPGKTLPPGSYSIRVLDHLQDRYIVRVDSTSGDEHTTFIGVQDPKLKAIASSGVVPWGSAPAGNTALRGFSFGGSSPSLEFVYPKNDAVALAKLNGSRVPAIDPASEGKPAELAGLSKDDMEIVTLWMLSSTRVGPGDTAAPQIKAEKLQQVAKNNPPAKPPIAKLPHTGSDLPSLLLLGVGCAGAATMLGRRRAAQSL